MDQRTSDVEEDLKDILNTRLALAEKIQMLEQRVEETVHGTKTAVLDVIDQARNTAVGLVEETTKRINPAVQAGRRPWVVVGSAIAIGFIAGLLEQRSKSSGVYAYYPAKAKGADVMPTEGQAELRRGVYPFYSAHSGSELPPADVRTSERDESSVLTPVSELWNELADEFVKERDRIQEAALQAGKSFIRDIGRIAVQSLVDSLGRPGTESSTRVGRIPNDESDQGRTRISRAA